MAKKRMFSEKIVESDAFLDMPLTSQALYFHLGMEADDDGFVGNAKRIQRAIGAADDDMNILIAKRFILRHSSGIVVIKHWLINNTVRKDRYTETMYGEIKDLLTVKDNGAYTENTEWQPDGNQMATNGIPNDNRLTCRKKSETVNDEPGCLENTGSHSLATNGIPNDNQTVPQVRLGEVRLGKDRGGSGTKRPRSSPPTIDEVRAFVSDNNLIIDPERFFYYYEGKGWAMEDWKATAMYWDRKDRADGRERSGKTTCAPSGTDERIGGLVI